MADLDSYERRVLSVSNNLVDEVLALRMRPFRDGVHAFGRMVRDLARSLGKEAQLTISGEDTLVDRDILASIEGPLNHMLRNAVDHGMETPDRAARRRQAGGRRHPARGAPPQRHAVDRHQRRRPRRRPRTDPPGGGQAQAGQRADGGGDVAGRTARIPVPARVQPEGNRQRDFRPRRRPRHRAAGDPRAERQRAHRVRAGPGLPHLDHAAADPVDRARAGGRRAGRGLRDPDRQGRARAEAAAGRAAHARKQAVLRLRRRAPRPGVGRAGARTGPDGAARRRTAGGGDRRRPAPLRAGGRRHPRRAKPGGAADRSGVRQDARHRLGRPARRRRAGADPRRRRPAAVDRQAAARRRAAPAGAGRRAGTAQGQAHAGGRRFAHRARDGAQAAARARLPGRHRHRRHRRLERGAQRRLRPGHHRRRHAAHGRHRTGRPDPQGHPPAQAAGDDRVVQGPAGRPRARHDRRRRLLPDQGQLPRRDPARRRAST